MAESGQLQQFQRDGGAGFCICRGVVVVQEGVAAGGGDGVELVIGQALAKMAAGGGQGVQEVVAGIMDAVGAEDGFEAAFIEAGVVGHEGDIGRKTIGFKGRQDAVFHLVPYIRKERGALSIIWPQTMDLLTEPCVVVRVRMDKAVEGVHHFPIAHDDHAHGAYAAGTAVGSFEVYDDGVVHSLIFESSTNALASFRLPIPTIFPH